MSHPIRKPVGLVVLLVLLVLAAAVDAAQRGWVLAGKSPSRPLAGASARPLIVRPQAAIGGDANGIYCTSPAENGVGIHDLGALPAGLRVSVTVEGLNPAEFNPVAAVVVTMLGQRAANTIKVTTFYDNDSGGENDAKVDFTTPHEGNYLLLVGDHTDAVAGCYRYQMIVS